MSDDKFQNKYRIPSARAEWHDYDGGIYFVTICTHGREHHFGEITMDENSEPKMILTPIGHFTNEQFKNVSIYYPYAEIPLWVTMPNHIHAVVVIRNDGRCRCRDAINRVSTIPTAIPDATIPIAIPDATITTAISDAGAGGATGENNPMLHNGLGAVIRGLKARVTKYAHENNIPFAWQSRFHDRIVRDTDELNRIAQYIENNVAKWAFDELNNN